MSAEAFAAASRPVDLDARTAPPTAQSPGLPAFAYHCPEFFRLERESLFHREWFALGFVDDVPRPGDVFPVVSAAGRPLLMVRGRDGEVRVFHNYCRHRGMRLVETPRSGLERIVCPYHAWCYALDGALIRRPHYYGFNRHAADDGSVPGLEPVHSAVWNRIVFANLAPEAPPFEARIGPLAKRWSRYDFSLLTQGARLEWEVAANWKLAIENFIDIYHVPYVHPSLNRYNNMADHYFVREGDYVMGQGNAHVAPTDAAAGRMPVFPGLDDAERSTMEALCVFPNLLVTLFGDNMRAILVEPVSAETCRERVEIYFVGEAALAAELEAARSQLVSRFPAFQREDVDLVTRLQRNLASAAFERAHFSDFFDVSVHHFQRMVARALEQEAR